MEGYKPEGNAERMSVGRICRRGGGGCMTEVSMCSCTESITEGRTGEECREDGSRQYVQEGGAEGMTADRVCVGERCRDFDRTVFTEEEC